MKNLKIFQNLHTKNSRRSNIHYECSKSRAYVICTQPKRYRAFDKWSNLYEKIRKIFSK